MKWCGEDSHQSPSWKPISGQTRKLCLIIISRNITSNSLTSILLRRRIVFITKLFSIVLFSFTPWFELNPFYISSRVTLYMTYSSKSVSTRRGYQTRRTGDFLSGIRWPYGNCRHHNYETLFPFRNNKQEKWWKSFALPSNFKIASVFKKTRINQEKIDKKHWKGDTMSA